jgi:hypothetical protein
VQSGSQPGAAASLPIALFHDLDNPHDRHAVAVIAAGWVVGYLSRDYAAIWQSVVLTEHASGRVITGRAGFTDTNRGIGLIAAVTQPRPPLPGEQPGRATCASRDLQPGRLLAAQRTDQENAPPAPLGTEVNAEQQERAHDPESG